MLYCADILKTSFLIFSPEISNLLYYSHLPAVLISTFVGLWVYLTAQKSRESRVFMSMSLIFSLLSLCNLITWTSSNSQTVSISWFLSIELFNWLMFLIAYFFYLFTKKKDISMYLKVISITLLFISPVYILSRYGITGFDVNTCELIINNNYYFYQLGINLLAILAIIWTFFTSLNLKGARLKNTLFFVATLVFSGFFLSTWHLSSFFDVFVYEQIGYIGFIVFIAIVAYIIVEFKEFDIKLIGAQALVWALVILVGSQFFFIQTNTNRILTAITLLISAIVGMFIVRSVKKEIALREELEIANNNQQALIHFISHQIKGFFTKSKMVFSGILEGDFGEASQTIQDMARVGLDSDNNAVAMVQDILGASNLKKGTIDYNFKEVDLARIVKKITDNFTNEIINKGLKLEIDIPDEPVLIMADETQITQVFKNLVDNSLRYTPTGEIKISLASSPDQKKVLFSVKDTGVGLSEKDKAKLFTEGGKGEESLKVNVNSTGYGLYIVKKIVESHHGKIWAESAGRGHGSRFCVELNLK